MKLSYNYHYPYLRVFRKTIDISEEEKLIPASVGNYLIQVGFESIYVQDKDTVFVETNAKGETVLSAKNDPLLFFSYKPLIDSSNRYYKKAPWKMIEDKSITTYSEYVAYVKMYIENQKKIVTNFYGDKKASIVAKLIGDIQDSEYENYLSPIVNKSFDLTREEQSFVSEKYKEIKRHIQNRPDEEYYFRNKYILIGLVNEYEAGIYRGLNTMQPAEKEKLFKNVIASFNNKVSNYYNLTELRSLAGSGTENMSDVAEMIYAHLQKNLINKEERALADSFYYMYRALSVNLSAFGNIELMDKEGKSKTLASVLEKGKPVLIDFWATWCMPCIEEMPYLDSMQMNYKEVQFLSLSIDENIEKWKKFDKMGSHIAMNSFLIPHHHKNKLWQHFTKINNTVPRYILFGASGKCINPEMPPPSTKAFATRIKQVLEQQ